jgi:LCP family protein required for cell wall assembly
MSHDPDNRAQSEDPPYRVYGGREDPRSREDERPYRTYRSAPRGLLARLRGEDDATLGAREPDRPPRRGGGGDGGAGGRWRFFRGPWTWKRGLAVFAGLIAFWLLLSLVLFVISASLNQGNLPSAATSQLTSGGNMLFSANNVLILGTDQRPKTGKGSKEPGSNYNDAGSRSDTIMLWRVGGGVSRRLSIPRDTLAPIPGFGTNKINAAYALGGPALAIKTVEQFTGVKINHLIVINLGNFPKFIDDVGGVTIKTNRVCSEISGGAANGGFTLNLRPGVHHLNGQQALILARTRENRCNPAENDITREKRQQAILNAIKSQLFSLHTFLHLPWVAWDAPGVLRTDMGPLQLLSMFTAAELGGSAPVKVLKTSGGVRGGADVLFASPAAKRAAINQLLNG